MSASPATGIGARTLVAYGLPGLVLFMPTIPAFVFLPKLYGDAIGLTAAGAVLLFARVFDVMTDPVIGGLSDRFTSPIGRRRPWIAVGSLLAGFGLIQLFMPPETITATYFLLWAVVLYLGWTMVYVPYTAWGAELSTNYQERARITGLREGLSLLGIVIAGAMPFVGSQVGWTETESTQAIAWIAVILGAPAILLLLLGVREVPPPPRQPARRAWRQELATMWQNKPFVRLVAAWFLNGLANGIPAVLFLYYLEFGLQASEEARGALILLYFVAAVGGIPIWIWLTKRYNKHRLWCTAMIVTCACFVWVPLIPAGEVALFAVICLITGAGLGADNALPPALQADVLDYDEYKTGKQRAGVFFAVWSMSTKLALAAAAGIALPLAAAVGFSPDGDNTPQALMWLAVIYAIGPVVLKTGAVALVWSFPITEKRQTALRQRIARRSTI